MNDDCGQCPMCGEALIISKKLLYECSNAKCNYVEFQYQNMDKGKKTRGIEDGYNREMEFFN